MADKEEKKERYELVEIATQTAPAIKDNKTEETLDIANMLCRIANDIEHIKKHLTG